MALSPFFFWCSLAQLNSWRKYYIQPCKSIIFVSGLAVTHKCINYAVVDVLITFFTDGSHKEPIVHAAALINLGEGLSGITLVFMTATSSFHASHLRVILCSTLAYAVGLLMLCLNAYHVNVFNMIPRTLYYSNMIVVVIFIYVGKTGSKPILDNFFNGQLWFHSQSEAEGSKKDEGVKAQSNSNPEKNKYKNPADQKKEKKYKKLKGQFQGWRFVVWLLSLVPILTIAELDWPLLLLVSLSMVAASCVLFWCGVFFYHPIPPMLNPLSVVIRVVWAAFSNRKAQFPKTRDQFFHTYVPSMDHDKFFRIENENEVYVLPSVRFFRWVDKAAIKDLALAPEEQEKKCKTVMRVQETKHVLKMFPIWICFLGFGVARATWKTFFVVQADDMSNDRDISVQGLLLINTVAEKSISFLWDLVSRRFILNIRREYIFLKLKICLGMLLSCICLVVSWCVARKKQKTSWNLTPQFCLSGFAEGLALEGLALFFNYRVPESMRGYGDVTNEVVNGTGHLLTIICLYILRSTCFVGEDIGSISLYKYYAIIAVLSFISFFLGSWVLHSRYAYNSDLAETGYLDSEEFFMNDASEQEKHFHAEAVQSTGGDPDAYKDAVLNVLA